MTTTLAIPKKIATHQPKPTKTQLVEALISRARVAHDKANEARGVKRDAIEAQIKAEALKTFRSADAEAFDFSMNMWQKTCSFTLDIKSPQITQLLEKMRKFDYVHFDRDATKKKIIESLATPNPLLADENTAKALDQLLERIMNVKPAIEA
jgi:hypothetical protein